MVCRTAAPAEGLADEHFPIWEVVRVLNVLLSEIL